MRMMKDFLGGTVGRSLFVHLTAGDDVLLSIREACRKNNIQTGILTSGIGSMSQIHYHYILSTDEKPRDEFETVKSPLELINLQGVILEGEPHIHMMATESGHQAYAGHLEEGCLVQYLVEISILEILDAPLGRRADDYATVTHFQWINDEQEKSNA